MSERIAPTRTPEFEARLKKRYASERRFRALGLGAIVFSVAVLVFLLGTMTFNGIGGFQRPMSASFQRAEPARLRASSNMSVELSRPTTCASR